MLQCFSYRCWSSKSSSLLCRELQQDSGVWGKLINETRNPAWQASRVTEKIVEDCFQRLPSVPILFYGLPECSTVQLWSLFAQKDLHDSQQTTTNLKQILWLDFAPFAALDIDWFIVLIFMLWFVWFLFGDSHLKTATSTFKTAFALVSERELWVEFCGLWSLKFPSKWIKGHYIYWPVRKKKGGAAVSCRW